MGSRRQSPQRPARTRPESRASKGGIARRDALSPEERSAIAKKAAEDRWATIKGLPKETHSGVLKLGTGIPCSVLDNGKRVFSVTGLLRAFGAGGKKRTTLESGIPVPEFLSAVNLRPYISTELREKLENTIEFRGMHGGSHSYGYAADILNLICDAILDARAAGVLRPNQLRVAGAAEALMRAFSKVGVIALIDEATGYQADRASEELQRLVEAYVVEDMRPWVKLFPDRFFQQIYRIHGWKYQPGVTAGPRYVGKFINKYVYERLPDRVLARLRELNPVVGTRRKHKHFMFLTEDIGEPTVDRHLASVTTLMSVAANKQHFDDMFKVAFPKPGEQLIMSEILHPPVLQEAGDDTEADDAASAAIVKIGGVETVPVTARTSEKILDVLRRKDEAAFGELGIAAYGNDPQGPSAAERNTRNKLGRLLDRMRMEGLVESPSRGIWRLRKDAPG